MPRTQQTRICIYRKKQCWKIFVNKYVGESKNLAKTSGTPGKTQLINHFIINNKWYIVDLPGYGYAKRSQNDRNRWEQMIEHYFKKEPTWLMFLC
jgi:GTP-binding protein